MPNEGGVTPPRDRLNAPADRLQNPQMSRETHRFGLVHKMTHLSVPGIVLPVGNPLPISACNDLFRQKMEFDIGCNKRGVHANTNDKHLLFRTLMRLTSVCRITEKM